MSRAWKFDEWNPYEDAFEESGLKIPPPGVFDIVFRTLDEIQSDPTRGTHIDVAGKSVHAITTPPHPDKNIPALLVAYTIDESKRLIQPLLISRASDVRSIADEVRDVIENAPVVTPRPREIQYPDEPTTIPKELIIHAVESAIEQRRKRERRE